MDTSTIVAPVGSEHVSNDQHSADQNSETQNHKGETMGEEVRQDQHSADQNNQDHQENGKPASDNKDPKRSPYNGSKPHGVVPAKLENVEAASKAKIRLQLNLEHLNKEYAKHTAIIQDPNKSISEKVPAVKATERINEQLEKLQGVANALRARIPELEELAKDSVLNFDPENKVEVTI